MMGHSHLNTERAPISQEDEHKSLSEEEPPKVQVGTKRKRGSMTQTKVESEKKEGKTARSRAKKATVKVSIKKVSGEEQPSNPVLPQLKED